ncbi:MAG: iron ABC transporter substrate-binding protein [Acidocella sp.]|nr:iron ABC transporter substrate-binding protein [Acidocella sp.]
MKSPKLIKSGIKTSLLAITLAAAPACAGAETLTLYSAQHEQVVDMLTTAFTKQTGIKVRVHEGEGPEIAAQILQEGSDSPADVFFTENSPELILLDEKGLLAPVNATTLHAIPARYSASDGNWVGVLARENVIDYNPSMIAAAKLPASLLDFAQPQWAGKIGIAPSDADFLPLVSAVIRVDGKDKALAWLRGLKANAKIYQDDESVVAAVARGDVATGIVNNYYWARLETDLGPAKIDSKLYHFKGGDVGGLINVSGAAVLKSSHHQQAAQKFLAFLVSHQAQAALGQSDVDFEYPLRAGVPPNKLLTPFATLQPPSISVSALGNDQDAGLLLQQAGLI